MEMPPSPPAPDLRARPAPPNSGRPSSERLRLGLTGLAGVFLIVLIAAASLQPTGRDNQPGTGEPLAVLGVAPGPATRPADSP
jgi:hypothetical protein